MFRVSSVQSSHRLGRGGGGGTWHTIQQILFQCFLHSAVVSSSGMGRDVSSLILSTTASPTLQGSLEDGSREDLLACDMPEPCKFPSFCSCQERFLRTHKEVYLTSHPAWSCAPSRKWEGSSGTCLQKLASFLSVSRVLELLIVVWSGSNEYIYILMLRRQQRKLPLQLYGFLMSRDLLRARD